MQNTAFQSTRPRGARLVKHIYSTTNLRFQSTRPRGARRSESNVSLHSYCFNPRARAGRDIYNAVAALNIAVSIHAPARGATNRYKNFRHYKRFQSTRPRGARRRAVRDSCAMYSFNPRARAGRDIAAVCGYLFGKVSIHAPARGATLLIITYSFQRT